jgi:hypothetical protein
LSWEKLSCHALLYSFLINFQDELHRLIGIFVVNGVSLEARQKSKRAINGICGKALFPTFALINHDCLANASFTVDTSSHPR